MQDIRCVAGRAVSKGELHMLSIIVGELVGAAGTQFTRITNICLCIYFTVEPDGVARDSEDKVKFSEGHRRAKVRVTQREITTPFRGSTNNHSVKHKY